jgi:prevent-host-death family protein
MTVTLEEAQSHLTELVEKLAPGDEVVITRDGKPVARLTPELPTGVPIPGRGKGKLTIVSDDDEHLNDFAEYM